MTQTNSLRLLCVFAHPDDESLGTGGTLARYAAEGVETHLVCATRGERGWPGPADQNPGMQALGRIREGELRAAAPVLGLRDLAFLDYIDGDLDKAEPREAIARIVGHIRRVRPQVIVTFSPDGTYGHPDHIAISQFTSAAVMCAADATFEDAGRQPAHRVQKLYYMVDSQLLVEAVKQAIGGIGILVDTVIRRHVGWEDWAITTRVDVSDYWQKAWQASQCHQTQLPGLGPIASLPDEAIRSIFANQGTFYRAFSLVNGGRAVEADLFEGLRP